MNSFDGRCDEDVSMELSNPWNHSKRRVEISRATMTLPLQVRITEKQERKRNRGVGIVVRVWLEAAGECIYCINRNDAQPSTTQSDTAEQHLVHSYKVQRKT